jgi:hypothetical protein
MMKQWFKQAIFMRGFGLQLNLLKQISEFIFKSSTWLYFCKLWTGSDYAMWKRRSTSLGHHLKTVIIDFQ